MGENAAHAPLHTTPADFAESPFSRRWRIMLFVGLMLLCAFTRLWMIGEKAIMHDEALFVYYTYAELHQEWRKYYYQPILHGPAMLHLQNIVFHVFGDSDYTMRLGCALLGFFAFFWIWKLRYWLGEAGTWFALAAYSLAPGITFYQRFFRNDSLFLFTSLWIIASLANWWRTRNPRWMASAIIGWTVLFTNKESSLFVYFSIVTYLLLLLIHDQVTGFFKGMQDAGVRTPLDAVRWMGEKVLAGVQAIEARLFRRAEAPEFAPGHRFPNPVWGMLFIGAFIVLALTQIFEGITYEYSVRDAIGHDWVLKDIRSIPLALGWVDGSSLRAPDASPAMRGAAFWIAFYGALFGGLFLGLGYIKLAVEYRYGADSLPAELWRRIHQARFYILGAMAVSVALYLATFTTFFKHYIGFFDIYKRTWAYWGGQHEWGRIAGPFHQHLTNIAVYELPALVVVVTGWVMVMWRAEWKRSTGFCFLLMIVAFGAFHKLLFSGLHHLPQGGGALQPMNISYFKWLFLWGLAAGFVAMAVPRIGRAVSIFYLAAIAVASMWYFSTAEWGQWLTTPIYQNGEAVHLAKRHVNLRDYMEIQFNFDAGWNLAIVAVLIFFATLHAWVAMDRRERFVGFLVWWTVTSIGAASYAREAVPQIGIHAMMPLLLLAGAYVTKLCAWLPRRGYLPVLVALAAVAAIWNAKATFNLNFRHSDDIRERMVYGQTHRDLMHHMRFIQDYAKIAPVKLGENRLPGFISDYNNPKAQKDIRIFLKTTDWLGWPAKWYLRDFAYTEMSDPTTAIAEGWEFIFVEPDDLEKHPQLKEKYNTMRGRSTLFWTPNLLSGRRLMDAWKLMIPGHYLDPDTARAWEAFHSRAEWTTVWRYLWRREVFEGHERPVPSVSGREYLFCFRKDLF